MMSNAEYRVFESLSHASRTLPRVLVLLATYNGGRWLVEQIKSALNQDAVETRIVASDDQSSDETAITLERLALELNISIMPPHERRFGNANGNFLRLIRDCMPSPGEFVALSDQDDIWISSKLCNAINALKSGEFDAYSSNVTAFWDDGRQRLLNKSGCQKRFDHLFESAGPGCTFVFAPDAFAKLQVWVCTNYERLLVCKVHDWLIYCYFREQGLRWHIDEKSLLMYRQHSENEVGANSGWRAAVNRLRQVRHGAYRLQILDIAEAAGHRSWVLDALKEFGLFSRIKLALNAFQMRRRVGEALLLAVFFVIMRKTSTDSHSE